VTSCCEKNENEALIAWFILNENFCCGECHRGQGNNIDFASELCNTDGSHSLVLGVRLKAQITPFVICV